MSSINLARILAVSLLCSLASIAGCGDAELRDKVLKNDIKAVTKYLDDGGSASRNIGSGTTMLHYCVSPEMVKLLVDHGAKVDAASRAGNTPLHSAAFRRQGRVVAALIAAKADVNYRNNAGDTPLYFAVADVIAKESPGFDLFMSMEITYLDTPETVAIRALMAAGADPDLASIYGMGETPLHAAVTWENTDAVKTLVELGASTSIKNSHGQTPEDIERGKSSADPAILDVLKKK